MTLAVPFLPSFYIFYQASATPEKDKVSYQGKFTQNSKQYFQTSKDVLEKAREKCVNGLNAKTVCDKISKDSGEYIIRLHKVVNYETCGKYIDKKKRQKKNKGLRAMELSGQLSAAIMLQRSDPDF